MSARFVSSLLVAGLVAMLPMSALAADAGIPALAVQQPATGTPQQPAQPAPQPQPQQVRSTAGGGIGFGVKGGLLFSSFDQANQDFSNRNGWAGGIFFGGNRQGTLGVMAEVLYAKKGAEFGSSSVDLHYIEIPVLARLNIGSANRNSGIVFYGIGGPVFDLRLKAQQDSLDVKNNYESTDLGVIAGAGLEISRLLVEARYNWGLRNIAKASGGSPTDLKSRSFAVLAGIRFN